MSISPHKGDAEKPEYSDDLVIFIAMAWDERWALESIAQRTGIPAARCCKIAKEWWAGFPDEHKRPLTEELP